MSTKVVAGLIAVPTIWNAYNAMEMHGEIKATEALYAPMNPEGLEMSEATKDHLNHDEAIKLALMGSVALGTAAECAMFYMGGRESARAELESNRAQDPSSTPE